MLAKHRFMLKLRLSKVILCELLCYIKLFELVTSDIE